MLTSTAAHAEDSTRRLLVAGGPGVLVGKGTVCRASFDVEGCSDGTQAVTVDVAVSLRVLRWLGLGIRGAWGYGGSSERNSLDGGGYALSVHPGRLAGEARFYIPDTDGWSAWGSGLLGIAFVRQSVTDVRPATSPWPPIDPPPASKTSAGPAAGLGGGVSWTMAGPLVFGFEGAVTGAWIEREPAFKAAFHPADGLAHYGYQTWITLGAFLGCDLAL